MPGVIDTPMARDEEVGGLWPSALNMPPSWVVWAIFAAARFRLVEISVPPGAATFEKLAALMPGVADSMVHWGTRATAGSPTCSATASASGREGMPRRFPLTSVRRED